MPPVFDRPLPDPHPFDIAIAAWQSSPQPTLQAMARNIMHDPRVSRAREAELHSFFKPPYNAASLQKALIDYFQGKVREKHLPHYVLSNLNANNILINHDVPYSAFKMDTRLVRILDINGLGRVFLAMRRLNARWKDTFRKFPRDLDEAKVSDWLDKKLSGTSAYEVRKFITTVLEVVNEYSKSKPFQPTWVTTWRAFEPYVAQGPNRWLEILGVAKPAPRWVILLRYAFREAGTVARPTQLDAGWYEKHFPSPRQAPLLAGGHPMDLRIIPGTVVLLPEFIHKQIQHPIAHWTNLESAGIPNIGQTTPTREIPLPLQRKAHHKLLVTKYGHEVYNWMRAPM